MKSLFLGYVWLFLLMISVSTATIVFSNEQYNLSNKSASLRLIDLLDKELPVLKLKRVADDGFTTYLNLIKSIVLEKNMDFDTFNKMVYEYKGIKYTVLKTDIDMIGVSEYGGIYYRYLDGYKLPFKAIHNTLLEKELRNIVISYMSKTIPSNEVDIVYAGIGGETAVSKYVVKIYNGTPVKTEIKDSIEKPYEKYYIYVKGLRILYPLIVRGVELNSVKTSIIDTDIRYPRIQYLKGFIPYKPIIEKNIIIDNKILDKIVESYTNLIKIYNLTTTDIRIYDLYLSASSDGNYLLPTLKIGSNSSNTIAWIQITSDGRVIVKSSAILAGSTGSDPGDIYDLKTILEYGKKLSDGSGDEMSRNGMYVNYLLVMVVAIASSSATYIVATKIRKSK